MKTGQEENADLNADDKVIEQQALEQEEADFKEGYEEESVSSIERSDEEDFEAAGASEDDDAVAAAAGLPNNDEVVPGEVETTALTSDAADTPVSEVPAVDLQAENAQLRSTLEELSKRQRKLEGRFGEVNAKINKPAPKPTKEEISEAFNSGEKMLALKEEFPEFAAALDESLSASQSAMLKHMPETVSEEQIQRLVSNGIAKSALDTEHVDWENTVKTDEFIVWAYEDGPTDVERGVYRELSGSDPAKAESIFQGLMDKYPLWGETKGRLLNSGSYGDAKSMLDQFVSSRTAPIENPETNTTTAKERLRNNAVPTKGKGSADVSGDTTEEDDFLEGFNS